MSNTPTEQLIHKGKNEPVTNRKLFEQILRYVNEYIDSRDVMCAELILTTYSDLSTRLDRTISSLNALRDSELGINLPTHPKKDHLGSLCSDNLDQTYNETIQQRIVELVYLDPSFNTVFVEIGSILTDIKENLAQEIRGYEENIDNICSSKNLDLIDEKWLDFDLRIKILFSIIEQLKKTNIKRS